MVTALGIGFALWQDTRITEQRQAEEAANKLLPLEDLDAVTRLNLFVGDRTFTLEKQGTSEGSHWVITAPVHTPAEDSTINAMVRHFVELKHKATVDQGSQEGRAELDLALFGLQPPRFKVVLTDPQGTSHGLLVGKRNSFDGSIYVQQEGSNSVHLVAGSIEYQVDKTLFQLRDRRLLAFGADGVNKLQVRLGSSNGYTLERRDQALWLTEPKKWLADSTAGDGVISALGSIRAKAFVSEAATGEEMAKYHLEKPAVLATAHLTASGEPVEIRLGREQGSDDSPLFATLGVGAPILEVTNTAILRTVVTGASDLRDKHVLRFERSDVAQLSIEKGDHKLSLEKRPQENNETWFLTAPKVTKAMDSEVSGLLYRLWSLEATRVAHDAPTSPQDVAAMGLDSPGQTVELFDREGESLGALLFGFTDGDQQYVKTRDSGRVDRVPKTVAEEISVDISDYQDAEDDQG